MHQQKLTLNFPYFLSLILLFISCKTNLKTAEVVFWCVDQFGQAVSNAKITIGNEEKSTNQEGVCIFKFNDNNQNLKLKAVKEGFFFLGPEEIYLESGRNIDYVISFLRSTKISVRAWKQSWNTETRRYYEREPFPGVEIVFEGKENQVTDDAGRLDLHLESEREGSAKIIARAYDSNLLRQKIEKVIRLKKDVFEYSEEFEFKNKKDIFEDPIDFESKDKLAEHQNTRIIIYTVKGKQPVNHTIKDISTGIGYLHVLPEIPISTRSIEIHVSNEKPAIISLNLKYNYSDSLVLDFTRSKRKFKIWRKGPGEKSYPFTPYIECGF